MTCTGSLLKVLGAVDEEVARCVVAGDSMSSLLAVKRPGANYRPYFQNRVSEIQRNLAAIQEKVTTLEPLQKIPGNMNPADLATRGKASLEDIDRDSEWQTGPDFLSQPRSTWPMSLPEEVPGAIPETELRKSTLAEVHLLPGQEGVHDGLSRKIQELQARSNSLDAVT